MRRQLIQTENKDGTTSTSDIIDLTLPDCLELMGKGSMVINRVKNEGGYLIYEFGLRFLEAKKGAPNE